jgi:monoamine oxidase
MNGENQKRSPYRYTNFSQVTSWPSFLEEVFKYPDCLDDKQSERSKKVCIVGGGIAGLTAAYELSSRHNIEVTLLEASNRFGGRIWTHRFSDDTYGELGAMRIPVSHICVCHYVKKFKLPYRRFVSDNVGACFHLRGEGAKRNAWIDLLHLYQLDPSERREYEDADALEVMHNLIIKTIGTAGVDYTYTDFGRMLQDFEIPQSLDHVERLTLGQVLRGAPKSSELELDSTDPRDRDGIFSPRLSSEAYEYLGRASGLLWLERASFLQGWVNKWALEMPGKYELVNGMETLVDAFIHEINKMDSAVISKSAVVKRVSLIHEGDKVEVTWEPSSSGGSQSDTFDYVICTTPAQPTARIEFDPPLQSHKYEALTNLSYASLAKTIVHCNQRYWEKAPYGIFGGGSFTDLPIQHVWYPSDNSEPDETATQRVGPTDDYAVKSFECQLDDIDGAFEPRVWKAIDTKKSEKPGVFTAAYMWDANARRFAAMSKDQRDEVVVSSLKKLHKGIEHVIEDIVHYAWDEETNPGHGAFAFFAPGEQRRYQAALCEPWPSNEDGKARVFFAGEHVAIMHAWIQSAMQSSLTAVVDVLEAP